MQVVDATDTDFQEILAIYNDAVLNTTAIWNEAVLDLPALTERLSTRRSQGLPILAARNGDGVLGYCSYGPWRAWDGYRYTVEHSVYVRGDYRRRGVGTQLLKALIHHARGAGMHVMVAGIEASNAPSITMHQRLGFTVAGTVREVGRKFGRWLDLSFMQLLLDERRGPPKGQAQLAPPASLQFQAGIARPVFTDQ